jgi:hypothetical protein
VERLSIGRFRRSVLYQRFNTSGAKVGGVRRYDEQASDARSALSLAMDSSGRFGLCWVEQAYDPNTARIEDG